MFIFGKLLQDKQHPDGGVSPSAPTMIRKSVQTPSRVMTGTYRPETLDVDARTVEMVFTTGESGVRYDWWEDVSYLEELEISESALRSERLDKGLPLFDNHRTYQGVKGQHGVTENWRIESGQIIGTVRFAKDPESDSVFQKVADGITRSCSLGYKVHQFQHIKAGEENKLDTLRAIDWEPVELSLAPVPFEKGLDNGVRSERNNEPTNTVEILTEDENMFIFGKSSRQLLQEKQNAEGGAAPVAAPAADNGGGDTPGGGQRNDYGDDEDEPSPTPTEVRGDIRAFTDAANAAGLDTDHAITAYERGDTINKYRADVLKQLGTQSREDAPRVYLDGERQDHKENVRKHAEDYVNYLVGNSRELSDGAKQFRGARLMDIGNTLADLKGRNQFGFQPMQLAKRAMHTSTDFPLLLENVMNKSLQRGYEETPRTFLGLGERASVNDFRAKHTYKMGDAPSLKRLDEHGKYQSGTFSESKESYAIDEFARMISFTRKLLINDDMNALGRFPRLFGQAGSRLESDIVWGLLLNYDFENNKAASFKMADGKAYFHADHNNYLAGANTAFSKAALKTLRMQGRKAKTLDGNFMNITFTDIAAPEELESDIEEILFNTTTPNTDSETNSFKNKFNVRIEPRLAVVSDTAWFAFSNMLPSFEYAYLAGEEGMMTEVVNQVDSDGLTIKVRKDFGAGYVEERGAFMMKGKA